MPGTFRVSSALELHRARNRLPVANLVASTATATMPREAAPVAKAPRVKESAAKTAKRGFDTKASGKLQQTRKSVAASAVPKKEKTEFSSSARLGFMALIVLNILADLADFGFLFAGIGEVVSMVFDVGVVAINTYFLGMNPKQKRADKGILGKILVRYGLVEFIPIISMFNLRSVYVIKIYRQRKKLHEEAMQV
jgi:hypothetical protein